MQTGRGLKDISKLFLHKPDYSVWGVHLDDKNLKETQGSTIKVKILLLKKGEL